MKFGWESEKEKIVRRAKIDPFKKLEGIRLMNELADSVLKPAQKRLRRRMREAS